MMENISNNNINEFNLHPLVYILPQELDLYHNNLTALNNIISRFNRNQTTSFHHHLRHHQQQHNNNNHEFPTIFHHGNANEILNSSSASDSSFGDAGVGEGDDEEAYNTLSPFLIYGLGITLIATLGIFGNILSAIVLSRPQMRSSVTCLLLGLAFCDTLLIFLSILIFGLPAISEYSNTMLSYRFIYYPLWVPYLFPISITAQTGSVYLTLSVTIERYVAVCHPLHARSLCTWSRARLCVIIVILLSSIYNLPRWFEVCTIESDYQLVELANTTLYENRMCTLRSSSTYKTYYINWSYLIVMYLVPFLGLVIFNWGIYQQVRQANRARQVLSKLQRREMGLATMLLFVVCVFLLCNVLPLVNNILESFYDMTLDLIVQISNLLVVFNSSANFVIYCTCGERFRRLLLRLFKDFITCHNNKSASRRKYNNGVGFRLKSSGHGGGGGGLLRGNNRNRRRCSGASNSNNNCIDDDGDDEDSRALQLHSFKRRKSDGLTMTSLLGNKRSKCNKKRNGHLQGGIDFEEISLTSITNGIRNTGGGTGGNGSGRPNGTACSILITPTSRHSISSTSSSRNNTPHHHCHLQRHGTLVIDLSSSCGSSNNSNPNTRSNSLRRSSSQSFA